MPPKPQYQRPQPPPSPFSKLPTTSTPTPVPSASPPVALLWAHQLRRENNALVERILKLEKTVRDAIIGIEEERKREREEKSHGLDVLKGEIGKLAVQMAGWEEGLIGELEGRCEEVRGDVERGVEDMRRWREEVEGRWERELEGWRGEMRKGLDGLEGWRARVQVEQREREREVEELREEVRRLKERMGPERENIIVQDSQATETPSDMTPEVPDSQPGNQPLVETQLRTLIETSVPPRPSIELGTPKSLPTPEHNQKQAEGSPPIKLAQGPLSLMDYVKLGEDMQASYPGKDQESKIVEAFWEGVNDSQFKNFLRERLERDGWTWNVAYTACAIRDIVRQLSTYEKGKEDENRAVGDCGRKESVELGSCYPSVEKGKENEEKVLEKKRKRKRPSIPVVPIEDEDVNPLSSRMSIR